MPIIIGLGTASGVGKDTCANHMMEYLKEYSSLWSAKLSFAWKLKDIAWQLYSWAGVKKGDFYDTPMGRKERNVVLPELGMTVVELWIKLGTSAIRDNIYDKTWIRYVQNRPEDLIICADMRFPNEWEITNYRIKVINPRVPPREGLSVDNKLDGYTGWNYTIINDGSLDLLRERSHIVIEDILKRIRCNDDSFV